MGDLPSWRRDRPIGSVQRDGRVLLAPDFFRFLEEVTQTVDGQDGAAPGGADFVAFPSYPAPQKACAMAVYPGEQSGGAVQATYQAEDQAAVTAQYNTGCGSVTLARY